MANLYTQVLRKGESYLLLNETDFAPPSANGRKLIHFYIIIS